MGKLVSISWQGLLRYGVRFRMIGRLKSPNRSRNGIQRRSVGAIARTTPDVISNIRALLAYELVPG